MRCFRSRKLLMIHITIGNFWKKTRIFHIRQWEINHKFCDKTSMFSWQFEVEHEHSVFHLSLLTMKKGFGVQNNRQAHKSTCGRDIWTEGQPFFFLIPPRRSVSIKYRLDVFVFISFQRRTNWSYAGKQSCETNTNIEASMAIIKKKKKNQATKFLWNPKSFSLITVWFSVTTYIMKPLFDKKNND